MRRENLVENFVSRFTSFSSGFLLSGREREWKWGLSGGFYRNYFGFRCG